MRPWFRKPVLERLRATGEEVVYTCLPRNLFVQDGWTTEVGREGLGSRVVASGEISAGIEVDGGH